MSLHHPPSDDTPVDLVTGNLLRLGVLLSAAVLLVGGVVYLERHGWEKMPSREKFLPMAERYSRPAAILEAAEEGEAKPLIQVGLMLLIATPLLRVAFTAVAFAWRRDWVYVLIPLIVLAVLLAGIWTGQTE
jgi:uncharacterized membrane protein